MKIILVLSLISIYLILTWFPEGKIIAGGDVGIPLLYPEKILKVQSFAWWDTYATGITSPVTYTALPFYIFFTLLDKIGLTSDINQKFLFLSIFLGSSLSIYFLALNFFLRKRLAFIAALFYIFNLTSLSVWSRGVHNAMLMLLLAPLTLLILHWGVNKKKYTSIVLINIVSFLFSYVFGGLGYLYSFWLLLTFYLLVAFLNNLRDKKERRFILSYSLLLIITWIGTNFWWLLHFMASSGSILGQFTPIELKERGSDVLVALKSSLEPQYIIRGINSYSHYVAKRWGDIYLHPLFIILSWLPTIVIFSTTLVKSNYKSINWRFLFLLTIIVLIISKGVNPPFGLLNKIPYDFFPFLAPLRNPYEKVGILLIIPFSLLFALGVEQINNYFRLKRQTYFQLVPWIILAVCLTILVWPLWLGKLYIDGDGKKYIHAIPPYYKEAGTWMAKKTKIDDTRILHLPLAWWESVDYKWGYTGIEPSQSFFESSSINYHIGIKGVDYRIRNILLLLHNQDTTALQKAFVSLNIGWVIVHNETLFRDRILEPPERINKWLATSPYFLEKVNTIGPLDIWRVKDKYRVGHFYPAGNLINLTSAQTPFPKQTWDYIGNIKDSFLVNTKEPMLEKYISKNVVFPQQNSQSQNTEFLLKEDTRENLVGSSFELSDVDVTASYKISFDVSNPVSFPLFLTITHDNDPLDEKGNIKPSTIQDLRLPNNLQWQSIIFNYIPALNATSAILSFVSDQSGPLVKNLSVEKILIPKPALEPNKKENLQLGTVSIKWSKINPTLYELGLAKQTPPYMIVFSETFHPLWQITDNQGNKIEVPHFTINGFANGWFIESPLPEKIRVEFVLQSALGKGVIISLVVFIISIILMLYLDYKRRLR